MGGGSFNVVNLGSVGTCGALSASCLAQHDPKHNFQWEQADWPILGWKQTHLSQYSDALYGLGLVGDDYWLCLSNSDDLPDAPASCPCSIPL
jgi:hypothetical protein